MTGYPILNVRKYFRLFLKELGYNPKDYGLHSLRVGGATSVVTADTVRIGEAAETPRALGKICMYQLEPDRNRLRVTKCFRHLAS